MGSLTQTANQLEMLLIFLLAAFFPNIKGRQVEPEELYEDFNEIKNLDCKKGDESPECLKLEVIKTDYDCRYGQGSISGVYCYCCGAIYHYIEHGDICTRYCYKYKKELISPKYGNYPAIILPFNWGDNAKPESARLEDGTPFSIIPVNAKLSRLVYGIDTFDEEQNVATFNNTKTEVGSALRYLANEMLRDLFSKEDNVLFSPVGLNAVLSLLAVGAKKDSETEVEIKSVVGQVFRRNRMKQLNKKILTHIDSIDGIEFQNEVLLNDKLLANERFVVETFKYFDTETSYFNRSDLTGAVRTMNQKISQRTRGMIPSAVKSLADTDMMLINSLVLDLDWLSQFVRNRQKMTFTKADGSKVSVPGMSVSSKNIKFGSVTIGRTNQIKMKMISIPYADEQGKKNNVEMRILLGPMRHKGVEFLMDKDQNVDNILEQSPDSKKDSKKEVTLTLPVFSTRSNIDMARFLKSKGLETIFSSDAELTGFTKDEKKFAVRDINQQVFVNVTEFGTTAAAITRLDLALLSASEPKIVDVNVPFIFTIWDTVQDIPLIVGIINDPTQ